MAQPAHDLVLGGLLQLDERFRREAARLSDLRFAYLRHLSGHSFCCFSSFVCGRRAPRAARTTRANSCLSMTMLRATCSSSSLRAARSSSAARPPRGAAPPRRRRFSPRVMAPPRVPVGV